MQTFAHFNRRPLSNKRQNKHKNYCANQSGHEDRPACRCIQNYLATFRLFGWVRFDGTLALYGIAVVVAPAIGPTLGGWLSDNLSWHWCFLINVPVGLISAVLIYMIIPSSPEKQKERERLWAG